MNKKIARTAGVLAGVGIMSVAVVGCGNTAGAQPGAAYPSDKIRFIIPYAAGGPTDVTARALAPCLGEELGQSVVPENVAGGSGALGLQKLIGSKSDGHTVAIVSTGMTVLTPLVNGLDYSKDDITPIGVISHVPMNLVVGKDSPYKDAKAFIAAAKATPGKLNVAVSGSSTPQAIELQRLEEQYGVDITVVPFDGSAGATTALLGGHADAAFINDAPEVSARIEDGSFKPLAVSSEERQKHLPDTPTLVDLGYEDLTLAVTTYALAGPAGLPEEATSKLAGSLETCLKDAKTVETIGERFVPEKFDDAEALKAILDEGATVYKSMLKK
jgi:tripartite-type tricarboxylate transporter receptor subunit TctC